MRFPVGKRARGSSNWRKEIACCISTSVIGKKDTKLAASAMALIDSFQHAA
jgi:hypothetical protein